MCICDVIEDIYKKWEFKVLTLSLLRAERTIFPYLPELWQKIETKLLYMAPSNIHLTMQPIGKAVSRTADLRKINIDLLNFQESPTPIYNVTA